MYHVKTLMCIKSFNLKVRKYYEIKMCWQWAVNKCDYKWGVGSISSRDTYIIWTKRTWALLVFLNQFALMEIWTFSFKLNTSITPIKNPSIQLLKWFTTYILNYFSKGFEKFFFREMYKTVVRNLLIIFIKSLKCWISN